MMQLRANLFEVSSSKQINKLNELSWFYNKNGEYLIRIPVSAAIRIKLKTFFLYYFFVQDTTLFYNITHPKPILSLLKNNEFVIGSFFTNLNIYLKVPKLNRIVVYMYYPIFKSVLYEINGWIYLSSSVYI
jgi:hypothetical protein